MIPPSQWDLATWKFFHKVLFTFTLITMLQVVIPA